MVNKYLWYANHKWMSTIVKLADIFVKLRFIENTVSNLLYYLLWNWCLEILNTINQNHCNKRCCVRHLAIDCHEGDVVFTVHTFFLMDQTSLNKKIQLECYFCQIITEKPVFFGRKGKGRGCSLFFVCLFPPIKTINSS